MSQQKSNTKEEIDNLSTLGSWQQSFHDALLSELSASLQKSFHTASDEASKQRFAIYQNNVFHSLTTALGDLYPVVKKLVGDDFFTGTAGVYFRQHPPQKAAMVYLGEDFPEFLRHFEHTRNMAYLPDVAVLELARHRAYHSPDTMALTAEHIASVNPELLAQSIIELHPSFQCIQSPEPVFSIWQQNQDIDNNVTQTNEQKESIQLGEPQQVFVVRPLYSVDMYQVPNDIYQFIVSLQQRQTLAAAIENTLNKYVDFDVSGGIQFALQAQLFSGIKQP